VNAGVTHLKAVRRHRYLLSFPEQSFTEKRLTLVYLFRKC
jgi:hypothetical protein